jgi:general secretion pathway protein J
MTDFRNRKHTAAARGFTLVELVIALSILGVLSLLLVNGLRLATRTWDAVEQRTTDAHQGHLIAIFLQRQIELAQPLRVSRDASPKHISFVGQHHALRFVAPLPGHLGAGGMYWFALGLADGGTSQRLVLSYWLFQREDWERFGAADAEQAVLLEGVKNLQLEYLEPATAEAPARWVSNWEPEDRLPRLIRVQITTVSTSGMPWQEFLVAPKLAANQPGA